MLPRMYYPALIGNIYEKRATSVVKQVGAIRVGSRVTHSMRARRLRVLVGCLTNDSIVSIQRSDFQLFLDTKMELDYDQLLNKQPKKPDAVFAWHQVRSSPSGDQWRDGCD